MAKKYRVKDTQTGKTITFQWEGAESPTDADMDEIFTEARGGTPAPTAPTTPGPSLTDRAVEMLPAAGGLVGGIVGGIGGTVAGFGVGGVPGAIGGAALGGAGGEAARQLINRARGVAAPATPTEAATGIGTEAAIQGGSEALGGALVKGAGMAGRGLMEYAIRPPIGLAKEFPNIVETAIKERIPVGSILPGATKGSTIAAAKRTESAKNVADILAAAGAQGVKRDAYSTVYKPVLDVLNEVKKQPLGEAEAGQIGDMLTEFLGRHGGDLTPMQMKALKGKAQDIAKPIYKAIARGEVVGAEAAAKAKFNSAIATGMKDTLERIPGVAEGEARTKALIGVTKAVKQSELRRMSLMAEGVSGSAALLMGVLGPDGGTPEGVKKAALAWLVTRGALSPKATSAAALRLTGPTAKAFFQQFPRIAAEVVTQAQLQGQAVAAPAE